MSNPDKTTAELQFNNLSQGEKLLWAGKAGTGIKFTARDIFLIPFSIVWFGVASFWELLALIALPFPLKIILSLVGVPFVGFGLYLLAGRFWYDLKRRANTFYGITTKRVIIKVCRTRVVTETFDINTLYAMEINEHSDGSGTIKLDADATRYSGWKPGYVSRKTVWAIEYVQDVRSVYDLILRQQEIFSKSALADHLKAVALQAQQKQVSTSKVPPPVGGG
jgi:hypothetical protein